MNRFQRVICLSLHGNCIGTILSMDAFAIGTFAPTEHGAFGLGDGR